MVSAEVMVTITMKVDVSFQEERIESYDFINLGVTSTRLIGAESLSDEERRVLYIRAKNIAESQFDLDEIE